MRRSIETYAKAIAADRINPAVSCAEAGGWVLDSAREDVPLSMLNFGRFLLSDAALDIDTAEREWVIIPIAGSWTCRFDDGEFRGRRAGGPFAAPMGTSNAGAVYLPRGCAASLSGDGEVSVYTAVALGDAKPAYIAPGKAPFLGRGWGPWKRWVVTLVEPGSVSTNLVAGETWSPPGGWSGTPLHQHDGEETRSGESDHEEVYFHLSPNPAQDMGGAHTVQLLLWRDVLAKSYVVRDRTAFAIPGGAHPVAASPVAPALYGWCLAGDGAPLGMRDVPEFAFLHDVARNVDAPEKMDALETPARNRPDDLPRQVARALRFSRDE